VAAAAAASAAAAELTCLWLNSSSLDYIGLIILEGIAFNVIGLMAG
jgi:hypothetical protein